MVDYSVIGCAHVHIVAKHYLLKS